MWVAIWQDRHSDQALLPDESMNNFQTHITFSDTPSAWHATLEFKGMPSKCVDFVRGMCEHANCLHGWTLIWRQSLHHDQFTDSGRQNRYVSYEVLVLASYYRLYRTRICKGRLTILASVNLHISCKSMTLLIKLIPTVTRCHSKTLGISFRFFLEFLR